MYNKRYVETVFKTKFVDLEQILDRLVNQDILFLFSADAANLKHQLYFFNIFSVIGFSSNMNIVPLMYVYMFCN